MKRQVWYNEDGTGFQLTAADLFDLEPRALFSERREMERMRPMRLGFYLILRSVILPVDPAAPPSKMVRLRWRLWRGVRDRWAP